ncbi:hypothetical protein L218DRAFT_1034463, partial [Marasmius fiardii PR-910]
MATRTTTNTKPNTGSSNANAKGKTPASGPSTTANQRNPAMSTPASSTNTEDKRASKASESNSSSDTIRNPSVVPSPSHSNSAGWNGHTVPYQPKNNQPSPPGGDDRELPPHMNRNNGSRGNGGGGPPGNDPPSDHGDGYSSSTPSDHSDNEENRPEYGRRPSEDPKMMQKKDWTYDPTPQSEDEMLTAAFKQYEDLITTYLYCQPVNGNVGIQKTLLQSLPKPGNYHGEDDLTAFDEWAWIIIRWLNTADLCSPPVRWSKAKGHLMLTSVDIQRKNALAAFLKKSAWQWYSDVVEQLPDSIDPDDPLQGQWTFMDVLAGLYKHFVHESSITKVVEKYESIRYSRDRGVEGLFKTLKRYAKSLPTPPDLYNFKRRLILLLPPSMANDMAKIHLITAEKSTLAQIMEAALALEQ